jgi:hypothetical protein
VIVLKGHVQQGTDVAERVAGRSPPGVAAEGEMAVIGRRNGRKAKLSNKERLRWV